MTIAHHLATAALLSAGPSLMGQDPVPPILPTETDGYQGMASYVEAIGLEMVPIDSGSFLMGSPETEIARRDDEGPLRRVAIWPFWMGRTEVTWDLYRQFMDALDLDPGQRAADPQFVQADAVSRPTPPYTPMDFGMGTEGFPAISMTQFAARHFTKWLTMKTGRFYRLPTEAEWEYACRAGSSTAYSFGDDSKELPRYAWFGRDAYEKVGTLEPNAWGLYDMHGNVSEWVLDAAASYSTTDDAVTAPIEWPSEEYGRVVRGGSWKDAAPELRCAARSASSAAWKRGDPQLPRSIWYLTHARFVGFRVVSPRSEPPRETWWRYWDPDLPETRRILAEQSQGRR